MHTKFHRFKPYEFIQQNKLRPLSPVVWIFFLLRYENVLFPDKDKLQVNFHRVRSPVVDIRYSDDVFHHLRDFWKQNKVIHTLLSQKCKFHKRERRVK